MSKPIKISIKAEGGCGDCILANRFVPAILEKYPHSELTMFLQTNGSTFQQEMLESCFKHFYKEIITIPNQKSSEYIIETVFGRENYPSHTGNIPDKYLDQMFNDYDLFIDLHIDSLSWMNDDFDWFKYFRYFPRPQVDIKFEPPFNKYIVINLYTNTSNSHGMNDDYVNNLLKAVSQKMPVVCLVTDETQPIYEQFIKEGPNCKFFRGNWGEIAKLVENCDGMIAVDSGAKYLAYSYSKPIITYTKYATGPHQVMFSHKLRWLPFENDCLPPNFDLEYSLTYLSILMRSKVYWIKPDIQNLRQETVDRFNHVWIRY